MHRVFHPRPPSGGCRRSRRRSGASACHVLAPSSCGRTAANPRRARRPPRTPGPATAARELANATDPARMRFHTIPKDVAFWYSRRVSCLSRFFCRLEVGPTSRGHKACAVSASASVMMSQRRLFASHAACFLVLRVVRTQVDGESAQFEASLRLCCSPHVLASLDVQATLEVSVACPLHLS